MLLDNFFPVQDFLTQIGVQDVYKRQVFRSIVAQLAKPNEKFMYGAVREGGRARDFEEAIEWLVSAGIDVYKRQI